jgi:hypothetical protein
VTDLRGWSHQPQPQRIAEQITEDAFAGWIEAGTDQLVAYLAKWAAFEDFCQRREEDASQR